MISEQIQLCRGLRFLVTDNKGNINEHTFDGLYFKDTRHLNTYKLFIDNTVPEVLTSKKVEFNCSTCVMTNERTVNLPEDTLSIIRTQTLNEGLIDTVVITNNTEQHISFNLVFQYNADFADIFEIKHLFLDKGTRPIRTREITKKIDENKIKYVYIRDDFKRATTIYFDKPGDIKDWQTVYQVQLKPKEKWIVTIVILFSDLRDPVQVLKNIPPVTHTENEQFPAEEFNVWHLEPPRLETDWYDLERIYKQSLFDLASLRIQNKLFKNRPANLSAAGLPWFMAIFGRDSLITAYQTLLLGQDFALGAVHRLAQFQGKQVNEVKEEEPGKILHEIRFGEVAHFQEWVQFPYYGSVDSTPLFLILISEIYRWTGDTEFLNDYKENIIQALKWIDEYGDLDMDGFIEYKKKTPTGLDNQNWRDSWNSMVFGNGAEAEVPIASADVQGYVYDAKMRIAEIAKFVWKDKKLAIRLTTEARDLKLKFNKSFWLEEENYFALGLDKNKKPLDSLTSAIGHLLWSGIVEKEKSALLASQLTQSQLYSGWGVRTLSCGNKAYNPIGYHVGTVWPHDNSLIAYGLKKAGHADKALQIIRDMVHASSFFDYRLPEVFAGYERSYTPFPVQYPTASSPQAWAAGSAILFLQTLLGICPDPEKENITIDPLLPLEVKSISLKGVSAFGKYYNVLATHENSWIEQIEK